MKTVPDGDHAMPGIKFKISPDGGHLTIPGKGLEIVSTGEDLAISGLETIPTEDLKITTKGVERVPDEGDLGMDVRRRSHPTVNSVRRDLCKSGSSPVILRMFDKGLETVPTGGDLVMFDRGLETVPTGGDLRIPGSVGGDWIGNWRLIVACCLVCIGGFSQGVIFGWYPLILSGDPFFIKNLSTTDKLQLASMSYFGAALGAGCSGPLTRILPSHRLVPLLSLASALSWILVAASSHIITVIAGRFLTGLFVTCQAAISPNYIANLAPENLKGTLLSVFPISRNLAQLILTIIGIVSNRRNYLPWQTKSYIFGFAPSLILFLACPLLPKAADIQTDSTRAQYAAIGLFGFPFVYVAVKEPLSTKKKIGNRMSVVPKSILAVSKLEKLNQKKEELKKRYGSSHVSVQHKKTKTIVKSTLVLMSLGTCLSFSGIQPLQSFTPHLITGEYHGNSSVLTKINSTIENEQPSEEEEVLSIYPYSYYWASFAFLISQLAGSIISAPLTDLIGQRLVLIITSLLLFSCNIGLSVYYFFSSLCTVGSGYCYIPIIVFIIFALSIGVGITTLFTVLVGDTLPLAGQTFSLPVVFLWINLMNYVGNSIFEPINDTLNGLPLMFVFHSIVNIFTSIFIYFVNFN